MFWRTVHVQVSWLEAFLRVKCHQYCSRTREFSQWTGRRSYLYERARSASRILTDIRKNPITNSETIRPIDNHPSLLDGPAAFLLSSKEQMLTAVICQRFLPLERCHKCFASCCSVIAGPIVFRLAGASPTGGGGRGGRDPPLLKTAGFDSSQKFGHFSIFFLKTYKMFEFSNIFQTKWPKSEEKLNFGGRWVWVPMTLTPQ